MKCMRCKKNKRMDGDTLCRKCAFADAEKRARTPRDIRRLKRENIERGFQV